MTTTNPIQALEPCPLCGGRAKVIPLFKRPPHGRSFVQCERCGANGPAGHIDYAITAWNTRHPLPTGEGQVEQCDLEAAAAFHDPDDASIGWSIRAGRRDDHPAVKAFAAHRTRNTPLIQEEVVKALEGCEAIQSGPNGMGGMRVVAHFPNPGDECALFNVLNAALALIKGSDR